MTHPGQSVSERVVVEATKMQDFAARVVANGGEPSYAEEKLKPALVANARALAELGYTATDLAELVDLALQ